MFRIPILIFLLQSHGIRSIFSVHRLNRIGTNCPLTEMEDNGWLGNPSVLRFLLQYWNGNNGQHKCAIRKSRQSRGMKRVITIMTIPSRVNLTRVDAIAWGSAHHDGLYRVRPLTDWRPISHSQTLHIEITHFERPGHYASFTAASIKFLHVAALPSLPRPSSTSTRRRKASILSSFAWLCNASYSTAISLMMFSWLG